MAAQPMNMSYYYALSGVLSEPTKAVLKKVYETGNDALRIQFERYRRKVDYEQFLQNEWRQTELINNDLFRAYKTYKHLMEIAGFTPNLMSVDISKPNFTSTVNLLTIDDVNGTYDLTVTNTIATQTITLPYGESIKKLLDLDTSGVANDDVYAGTLHGTKTIHLIIFDELKWNKIDPLYERIVNIERTDLLVPLIGKVGQKQEYKPSVPGGKWKIIKDAPDTSISFSITPKPQPVFEIPSEPEEYSESETTEEETEDIPPPVKTTTFPQNNELKRVFLFFEDEKAVSHWQTYSPLVDEEYLDNFILLDRPKNLILTDDLLKTNLSSLKRSFFVVFSSKSGQELKGITLKYSPKLVPNPNLSLNVINVFSATINKDNIDIDSLDVSLESCITNFEKLVPDRQNKIIQNADDFHFTIDYRKPVKTIYLDWIKTGTQEAMNDLYARLRDLLVPRFKNINLRFLIKRDGTYYQTGSKSGIFEDFVLKNSNDIDQETIRTFYARNFVIFLTAQNILPSLIQSKVPNYFFIGDKTDFIEQPIVEFMKLVSETSMNSMPIPQNIWKSENPVIFLDFAGNIGQKRMDNFKRNLMMTFSGFDYVFNAIGEKEYFAIEYSEDRFFKRGLEVAPPPHLESLYKNKLIFYLDEQSDTIDRRKDIPMYEFSKDVVFVNDQGLWMLATKFESDIAMMHYNAYLDFANNQNLTRTIEPIYIETYIFGREKPTPLAHDPWYNLIEPFDRKPNIKFVETNYIKGIPKKFSGFEKDANFYNRIILILLQDKTIVDVTAPYVVVMNFSPKWLPTEQKKYQISNQNVLVTEYHFATKKNPLTKNAILDRLQYYFIKKETIPITGKIGGIITQSVKVPNTGEITFVVSDTPSAYVYEFKGSDNHNYQISIDVLAMKKCLRCKTEYLDEENLHGACTWHSQHPALYLDYENPKHTTLKQFLNKNWLQMKLPNSWPLHMHLNVLHNRYANAPIMRVIEEKCLYLQNHYPPTGDLSRLTLFEFGKDALFHARLENLIMMIPLYKKHLRDAHQQRREIAYIMTYLLTDVPLSETFVPKSYEQAPPITIPQDFTKVNPNIVSGVIVFEGERVWACCGASYDDPGCYTGTHSTTTIEPDLHIQNHINVIQEGSDWRFHKFEMQEVKEECVRLFDAGKTFDALTLMERFNAIHGGFFGEPTSMDIQKSDLYFKYKSNFSPYSLQTIEQYSNYARVSTSPLRQDDVRSFWHRSRLLQIMYQNGLTMSYLYTPHSLEDSLNWSPSALSSLPSPENLPTPLYEESSEEEPSLFTEEPESEQFFEPPSKLFTDEPERVKTPPLKKPPKTSQKSFFGSFGKLIEDFKERSVQSNDQELVDEAEKALRNARFYDSFLKNAEKLYNEYEQYFSKNKSQFPASPLAAQRSEFAKKAFGELKSKYDELYDRIDKSPDYAKVFDLIRLDYSFDDAWPHIFFPEFYEALFDPKPFIYVDVQTKEDKENYGLISEILLQLTDSAFFLYSTRFDEYDASTNVIAFEDSPIIFQRDDRYSDLTDVSVIDLRVPLEQNLAKLKSYIASKTNKWQDIRKVFPGILKTYYVPEKMGLDVVILMDDFQRRDEELTNIKVESEKISAYVNLFNRTRLLYHGFRDSFIDFQLPNSFYKDEFSKIREFVNTAEYSLLKKATFRKLQNNIESVIPKVNLSFAGLDEKSQKSSAESFASTFPFIRIDNNDHLPTKRVILTSENVDASKYDFVLSPADFNPFKAFHEGVKDDLMKLGFSETGQPPADISALFSPAQIKSLIVKTSKHQGSIEEIAHQFGK